MLGYFMEIKKTVIGFVDKVRSWSLSVWRVSKPKAQVDQVIVLGIAEHSEPASRISGFLHPPIKELTDHFRRTEKQFTLSVAEGSTLLYNNYHQQHLLC